MKKTLLSLLTVGAVGSAAFAATGAFFSDTETSTGNVIQAGDIDLTVDSTAHYVGMVCQLSEAVDTDPPTYVWADEDDDLDNNPRPELFGQPCSGTFASTDLTNEKFFNLTDVKPGDWGENTLSLTVTSNDAWACVDIKNLVDNDNTLSEPETDLSDTLETGELSQFMTFAAWNDDGDNIYEPEAPTSEVLYFVNETASSVLGNTTLALAESGDTPLTGGQTTYVGFAWCFGEMDETTLACDGTGKHNIAQTDSLTADLTFRVEQSRNNPSFKCSPQLQSLDSAQTN